MHPTKIVAALLACATCPLLSHAADGDPDPSFGSNGRQVIPFNLTPFGDDSAEVVLTTPNGGLYLVGNVRGDEGVEPPNGIGVVRLTSDGHADTTYGPSFDGMVSSMPLEPDVDLRVHDAVLQTDGKLVVIGDVMRGAADTDIFACRFDTAGHLDVTFGGDPGLGCTYIGIELNGGSRDYGRAVALQGDGKILVAGDIYNQDAGFYEAIVLRLDASGHADATFGGSGHVILFPNSATDTRLVDIVVGPDQRIVVAGDNQTTQNNRDFLAAAIEPSNGAVEWVEVIAFNQGGLNDDRASSVEVLPNGSVLVAGTVRSGPTQRLAGIAKLDADGIPVPTFGTGEGRIVHSFCDQCERTVVADVLVQSDGRIALAVTADVPGGGASDMGLMRLMRDGSIDPTFGIGGRSRLGFDLIEDNSDDIALSATLQSGRIVVAGQVAAQQVDEDVDTDFAVIRTINDLIFVDGFEGGF